MSPKMNKITRDVSQNKMRSLLVILSIALGVFAVGLTLGARATIVEGMQVGYTAANPAAFQIFTSEPVDGNLLADIRADSGVEDVFGRINIPARIKLEDGTWQQLELLALEDYQHIRISEITIEDGSWPPSNGEIFIERNGLAMAKADLQTAIHIEAATGTEQALIVSGSTHDVARFASGLSGVVYGYVSPDTLAEFDVPVTDRYNELHITLSGDKLNADHRQTVLAAVQSIIEANGVAVAGVNMPPTPGQHGGQAIIEAVGNLLVTLGVLTLILATFLIANTVSALMARQRRDIGIMKTVGARRSQLLMMYLAIPLVYGVLGLALALPAAIAGAGLLSEFVLQIVNFNAISTSFSTGLWGLLLCTGLSVPVLAAIFPIGQASSTSVRNAIDSNSTATSRADGVLLRLFFAFAEKVLRLSRPQLLSLRNTFRRRGRLVMTLITLTLGSAIFMSVATVRASTDATFEETAAFWQYDVEVMLNQPLELATVEDELLSLNHVTQVAGAVVTTGRLVDTDGAESNAFNLFAVPFDSDLLRPILTQGSWFSADNNQVVIDVNVLRDYPHIQINDPLTLVVDGVEHAYTVVGIVKGRDPNQTVYLPLGFYSAEIANTTTIDNILIQSDGTLAQGQLANQVEAALANVDGAHIANIGTTESYQDSMRFQFGIITMLLTVMSILITVVGGFGLAGTMGMNVLERIREIGVLRAIGASTSAVMQIVLIEGIVISLLSWGLGLIVSLPISRFLSDSLGNTMLEAPLAYTFSYNGVAVWFVIVVALAIIASGLPARQAAKLRVRDALIFA